MRDSEVLKVVKPVFETPDNLALRRVVGDALLERGHSWGEFIALQSAVAAKRADRVARRRLDELLKKGSVEQFLGPIAQVVLTGPEKKMLVFDHGFLAEIQLAKRLVPRAHWTAAARAPHWATVRKAEFSVLTTPQWWVEKWAALGARSIGRTWRPLLPVSPRTAGESPFARSSPHLGSGKCRKRSVKSV